MDQTDNSDDLIGKLRAALEQDNRVNLHANPLEMRLDDRTLVLEGQVDSITTKRVTLNTARALANGTLSIRDRIRVIAEPTEDHALRDEVVRALTRESAFRDYNLVTLVGDEVDTIHDAGLDAYTINASVDSGVVTLSGAVGSLSHRRLAEVLVWWTAGCTSVENRLEVMPPEEDNDDEITDALRMVLEKDPLVHADQLSIGTSNGVVEIMGSVASDEERRLAVLDAWYTPGIGNVVDSIGVRH